MSISITDIQNSTVAANAAKAKANMGSSELGQDAFLQLLMTQLKYQDPMKPMDSQQFLGQQAQFTQVQELQKLNKNLTNSSEMMNASSLIGMDVTIADPDNATKTINGTVSEAKVASGATNIVINNKEYPLSSVLSIKKPAVQ